MYCHGKTSPFVAYMSSIVVFGAGVNLALSGLAQELEPGLAKAAITAIIKMKMPHVTTIAVARPLEHTSCLHLCLADGSYTDFLFKLSPEKK